MKIEPQQVIEPTLMALMDGAPSGSAPAMIAARFEH
jgi:hypothetical protein